MISELVKSLRPAGGSAQISKNGQKLFLRKKGIWNRMIPEQLRW